LSGFTITGRVSSIFAERMLRYRYAKIKAKDHLNLWIQHLVLNTLRTPGYPRVSMIAGMNSGRWHALVYAPVEDSGEILESLLQEYWSGLSKPLHFFPETSLHYAQLVLQQSKSPDDALRRAESVWSGRGSKDGECKDPHFYLCFKSGNPLDTEFQRLAEGIFSPLLASQQELTSHE
jgi:exodeoxyribonuclease V gamma subunit